jgi:DNA invertase Pin-like site-specific DNA recombinase
LQIFIAYYRVSTDKQGVSGLGMDAQREAVTSYVRSRGSIVAEFTEVESGRKSERPQLLAALAECRRRKAVLVIAKLDRLARNVHFISGLMNSDVEFVAVDNPTASRLTIHILAAVAEHEREMISERTKAALTAAKARGIKLGNPRAAEALIKARAAIVTPPVDPVTLDIMTELRLQGFTYNSIASRLNAMRLNTPRGYQWYGGTVDRVLSRFDAMTKDRNDAILQPRYDEMTLSRTSSLNNSGSTAIPTETGLNAWRRPISEGCKVMFDIAEAYRMLDTFASVGALHFDRTILDIDGQKRGFRSQQTVRQLRESLPKLIPGLEARQDSLIVRPISESVQLIQLDDLNYEQLKPLAAVSLLILETSPGNHQAWVAVSGGEADAKDFARRLRKGVGADQNASGATRVAGLPNHKRKYEAAFPTVKILQAAPGRVSSQAQLEAIGVVAAPEPIIERPFRVSSVSGSLPDYQRCVLGAPMKHGEQTPDISRADFFYAMLCAQRGHSAEEIAGKLMELSAKAEENGDRYAKITADNAVAAADRQRRSRA